MNEIALAILSFRRYEMLKLELQTLAGNEGLGDVDIHVFQDGAVQHSGKRVAPDGDIERAVQVFSDAKLPNSFIISQSKNRGLVAQTFTAFRTLFGKGYKFVMLVPNDLLMGPFYLKTLLTIHGQFYDDKRLGVFMTLATDRYKMSPAESLINQDKVAFGPSPVAGARVDHGLWDYCWQEIEKEAKRFRKATSGHDYLKLLAGSRGQGDSASRSRASRLIKKYGTLDADSFIITMAKSHGFLCLHTVTPRAYHWGVGSLYPERLEAKRAKWNRYPELLDIERMVKYENGPTLWPAGDVDNYEVVGDRVDRCWEGEFAPPPGWVRMVAPKGKRLPEELIGAGGTLYPVKHGSYATVHADDRAMFASRGFKEVQVVYRAVNLNGS